MISVSLVRHNGILYTIPLLFLMLLCFRELRQEAAVSLVLVISFTLLLRRVMTGSGADLLQWFPMLVAACGNAVILAMQWKEKVNLFVLVFTALSAFLFAVGKIIFGIRKKGENAS